MRYSETVIDHFLNPRNVGPIAQADGLGLIGSAECGDQIRVWIRVKNERLVEVCHQVFGCPAAVAACSMMTTLAVGLTLDEAAALTDDKVAQALGGLPPQKYHCSNLAASALHNAIENFRTGQHAAEIPVVITTLVNNTMPAPFGSEHGLSFWIENGGKHILFDAGQTDLLVRNAALLDIDLSKTDAIVISHGHYDHTGAIKTVLEAAPNAAIYLHPNAPKRRYSCHAGKPSRDLSIPIPICQKIAESVPKGRVLYTDRPIAIYPGLLVTGPIPRHTDFEDTGGPFFLDPDGQTPDPLEDDQSLVISTANGTAVVLGCAHSGLINTLTYAAGLFPQPVTAIIGGMHLCYASSNRLTQTLDALKQYRLRCIAPCHCTGQAAVDILRRQFPDSFRDISNAVRITL
jgi:7,8-dihydropterin-6-yl-methyl-4-(beta-D-ribofuranosyl)aminobenzene 5'-phosphate synthase